MLHKSESRVKPEPSSASAPRVLVVKLSSLGDIFHALPLVRQLRRNFGARVDWVIQTEYAELAGCFPDVERVIAFPRRGFFRHAAAFLKELRQTQYDLVADVQGLLKSALIARMARAARRVGPSFSREGAHHFYDAVAGPRNRNRHAVDEVLDLARFLGLPSWPPEFSLAFPRRPVETPRPRVALAPCSRWSTKNWPASRFAEVGRALQAELGASIFLIGSDVDRPICESIAAGLARKATNLCGTTTLVELGSLLQEMDLLISVDSGPMHMAAALKVPVLAIFGATDPIRTGPYGAIHRVLTADGLDCRPCRSRVCARNDLACLEQITAGHVIATARQMLTAGKPSM